MLLVNGRIYTQDPAAPLVEALVVRQGRVAFAGRRGDVNPAAGEDVLDLGGRAVLPGLVDCHGHPSIAARARLGLDLRGLGSEEAVASRVGEAAATAPAGEWLTGRGWDQNLWPGARFPGRAWLDRAAPRHPVALVRVDGHALWVNSAALQAAGIHRGTADPPGGLIVRDARGEPTGLLVDRAQRLVERAQPRPSPERFERALLEVLGECRDRGLTGVHEMGADAEALAAYRRLAEAGRMPLRLWVAVAGRDRDLWAEWRERGPEVWGQGRVTVGGVKLFADGALGSRGAALHAPYADDPANAGLLLLPPEEIAERTREALARGFGVCVHAIGDRANTLVLDAFERALGSVDPALARDHRLRVEHAQVLRPEDVPRFGRLGVIASMQFGHCVSDMPWAGDRLGPERLPGAYAWRSLLAAGAVIAGGSDFPVEEPDPFRGLHAAVCRRPPGGPDPGWQPEQRLTREEAVRAYTVWAARAARQEGLVGILAPGSYADLVVLSDDPFTCPAERLPQMEKWGQTPFW